VEEPEREWVVSERDPPVVAAAREPWAPAPARGQPLEPARRDCLAPARVALPGVATLERAAAALPLRAALAE
jgi:hypothetical protein